MLAPAIYATKPFVSSANIHLFIYIYQLSTTTSQKRQKNKIKINTVQLLTAKKKDLRKEKCIIRSGMERKREKWNACNINNIGLKLGLTCTCRYLYQARASCYRESNGEEKWMSQKEKKKVVGWWC